MDGYEWTRRVVVGVAIVALCAGCSAGGGATPAPALNSATPAVASPTPTDVPSVAVASPTATPAAVVMTSDVLYEHPDPTMAQGVLDVYAPSRAGAWPVVVMFHGSPPSNTKLNLDTQARTLSALGFVVFVPSWGHPLEPYPSAVPNADQLRTSLAETACAVAFARSHATDYGGDPATMIVFGHSAGASIGAVIAFARPAPTAGCIGATELGAIDALVTWDGDWMAADPSWDSAIVADPTLLDLYTPLGAITKHKDLKVALLASENPEPYVRDLSDPAALASFFAVRDPSGTLRKLIQARGMLADGHFDLAELQGVFYSLLKAQGNPVSLDVLPGAAHDAMGGAAMPAFLTAFGKAAGG